MEKRKGSGTQLLNKTAQPGINYASKPRLIGSIIEAIVKQKGLDEKEIAAKVKTTPDNFKRWYKRRILTIEQLMDLSEALGENLISLYIPNLPPPPDPCAALQRQIEALKQEMKMMGEDAAKAKVEIIRLEAKIELLQEQLEEERKRKIIR